MFILGLDGLEYDFVEMFRCKNLKQVQYGRIDVPIDDKKGIPFTPQVWASFLRGKWIDDIQFINESKVVEYPLKVLRFIRRIIPISLGLGKKTRVKLMRFKKPSDFPKLEGETFLDIIDSATINAPFYDFENVCWEVSNEFGKGKISLEELIEAIQKRYQDIRDKILVEAPGLDKEIVFAYMLFPDYLQHLFYNNSQEIQSLYMDLDRFVKELKKKIDGDLLIVSDHGFDFETETHSLKGFYSMNRKINFEPRKITDFYNLLLYGGFD